MKFELSSVTEIADRNAILALAVAMRDLAFAGSSLTFLEAFDSRHPR
jgi:hypothetical protein